MATSPAPATSAASVLLVEPGETASLPGVAAALADLRRDLESVLSAACAGESAGLAFAVSVAPGLPTETFTLEIAPGRRVAVAGADELGVIYGIYEFSHRFLGVDPLWFWKDIAPAPVASAGEWLARLVPQRMVCDAPVFRYRGWFINDEDLLARWKPAAGGRFLDWPDRDRFFARSLDDEDSCYETRLLHYYTPIAAAGTMEMVFEALLRLRGNLIIPASFIDIMNEPEAALVRAAVRRGLHVSQHHIEPLGVAHFAYETWHARNPGQGAAGRPAFSYREAPDAMRACWRAYASRWQEVAGDRVVWQVGLRGRGDRPLWSHDPEAQARAGEFIAGALADQLSILREIDPRPAPPTTLTLWLEGAGLIVKNRLQVPAGITCVFADHHATQELQADFQVFPRRPERTRGCYYHVAVWPMGPHLVQGPRPERIARFIDALAGRGDTHYAIVNVSNLREHALGAQVFLEQVWRPSAIDDTACLERWSTPGLARLHAALLDCLPEVSPGFRLHDGAARRFIYDRLFGLVPGNEGRARPVPLAPGDEAAFLDRLAGAIARLEQLVHRLAGLETEPRLRSFFTVNLRAQATILLGLYRCLHALLASGPDLAAAAAGLETTLEGCRLGETGRWRGWYQGDTKMALGGLLRRIEALAVPAPA